MRVERIGDATQEAIVREIRRLGEMPIFTAIMLDKVERLVGHGAVTVERYSPPRDMGYFTPVVAVARIAS